MKSLGIVANLILGSIILLISSFFYTKHALDFKFVDEQHNFTIGKYLSKGEKVYEDIITNHQPLTYILSANLQQITKPKNGYLLVRRHRELVILWTIVWYSILILEFGFAAVIFTLIFELTKIHILGNLFLAESLIIYPLLYLLGCTLKTKLTKLQLFICGISFGLSLFLLLPIWPGLFFILIILILKQKKYPLTFAKFFLPGFLIIATTTFVYTSFFGYFYYTLLTNLTYTIPGYLNESILVSILKSFSSPLLIFLPNPPTPTLTVIRIFSFCLLVCVFVLIKLGQYKKIILVTFALGLLNIRFINPGTEGYSGFHILPWYAAFIFLNSLLILSIDWKRRFSKLHIFLILLLMAAIISSLNKSVDLFKKTDALKSYEINYSTHLSVGDTIKIMKAEKDTLFVSPDAWLVYYQADINHLPKLYGDYTWMAGFPALHSKIQEVFIKNPPTFFYCENCKNLDLERYLSKYQMAIKNKTSTNLYVLSDKIKQLNTKQVEQLKNLEISF